MEQIPFDVPLDAFKRREVIIKMRFVGLEQIHRIERHFVVVGVPGAAADWLVDVTGFGYSSDFGVPFVLWLAYGLLQD